MEDPHRELPPLDAEVIHERHRGRQYEIITRGLDGTALERLRFAPGVVAVESRTPSLEEIFVAYMTGEPATAYPSVDPMRTGRLSDQSIGASEGEQK
jgi:hypothetical protein